MPKKVVAIVDPYNAGRLLAPEFTKRGYRCVMVQSAPSIPAVYSSSRDESHFEEKIIHEGNLEATAEKLKALGVECIMPGVETGVELADYLSEKLGLASNGTKLSSARRNKYLMAEALKTGGVRHIPHLKSSNLEEVTQWIRKNNFLPAVLKPLDSAGSDSVFVCESEDEVRRGFANILGVKNKLDLPNDHVLVQPFISGTEYIVDSVSCQGEHFVTDIWRYKKSQVNGAAFVYDAVELLDPKDPIAIALTKYIETVLTALGIQYGPAHSEVLIDKDGPVLVESGARVSGGDGSIIVEACTGHSQADLSVEAYFAPEKFRERLRGTYERRKCALVVYLISKKEGILKDWALLGEVEKLPSIFMLEIYRKAGQRIEKTIDIFTPPGRVDMVHSNSELLWENYKNIREIESRGLFTVAPGNNNA